MHTTVIPRVNYTCHSLYPMLFNCCTYQYEIAMFSTFSYNVRSCRQIWKPAVKSDRFFFLSSPNCVLYPVFFVCLETADTNERTKATVVLCLPNFPAFNSCYWRMKDTLVERVGFYVYKNTKRLTRRKIIYTPPPPLHFLDIVVY